MPMSEYESILNLTAPVPKSADELEADMWAVLAAVETHASDIALGPAVSVDFDANSIDLAFCVSADTLSEVQSKTGQILAAIEQHTEVKFSSAGTCSQEPRRGADTHETLMTA